MPDTPLTPEELSEYREMLRVYRSSKAAWRVIMFLGSLAAGLVTVVAMATMAWNNVHGGK